MRWKNERGTNIKKVGIWWDKEGKEGKKGRKRKTNKEGERGKTDREIERERERENEDLPSFSKVKNRRSEKKSRSTHRGLRMGTKILDFCQTPRGRELFYLNYFIS